MRPDDAPRSDRPPDKPAGAKDRPFFPESWTRTARTVRGSANWKRVAAQVALHLTIFAAAFCLYLGVTEPVLKLNRLYFLTDEHSMWSVVQALFAKNELFLAGIIFVFSIVFPAMKLFYLLVAALMPEHASEDRKRLMAWMSWLGKWSMLDVLVLALVIFYAKSNDFADAATLPGIYYFTASVVLTMLAYGWVKRSPG
ncbi:MAG: paraquat-inducible protein A [Hyphomicrobiaceae bacterium]